MQTVRMIGFVRTVRYYNLSRPIKRIRSEISAPSRSRSNSEDDLNPPPLPRRRRQRFTQQSLGDGSRISDQLLRIKSEFIDSEGVLSSWSPGTDACSWYGVQCSEEQAHVVGVNLLGAGLSVWISLEFAGLISLQTLSGEITPHLANCSALEVLAIASCELNGSIPTEIGNFISSTKNRSAVTVAVEEEEEEKRIEVVFVAGAGVGGREGSSSVVWNVAVVAVAVEEEEEENRINTVRLSINDCPATTSCQTQTSGQNRVAFLTTDERPPVDFQLPTRTLKSNLQETDFFFADSTANDVEEVGLSSSWRRTQGVVGEKRRWKTGSRSSCRRSGSGKVRKFQIERV